MLAFGEERNAGRQRKEKKRDSGSSPEWLFWDSEINSEWSIHFVTLKCLYSGSERRGNTFPSKLLLKGKKAKYEILLSLRSIRMSAFFVTLSVFCALFLGMYYAKWVSGKIRDAETRLGIMPPRGKECRTTKKIKIRDSSSLTSFVPPEWQNKNKKNRLWNECSPSARKGVQSDFLAVTLKCINSGSRFLFFYQSAFRKRKKTRLRIKSRMTKIRGAETSSTRQRRDTETSSG